MNQFIEEITIIMPTYNQGAFIARAVRSVILQEYSNWKLLIINDGSTDYTKEIVTDFLVDARIVYLENSENLGLGICLNLGLEAAKSGLVAYLPSDDIFYKNHLDVLYKTIKTEESSILAYSGVKFNYEDNPISSGSEECYSKIENKYFQLVQVMHKLTSDRWVTRQELVTDDLDKMFWSKLSAQGDFTATSQLTCEWVDHPEQRHKIIRESMSGGIYLYKKYYNLKELIRFQSSVGNFIDEIGEQEKFKKPFKSCNESLKIVLVGELAYNADRICSLEEEGHKLYGLWMTNPNCYNTVGPLPFGNVEEIDLDNWIEKIKEIKPDIIYALLNYQAVTFAHYVLLNNPGIPFVWHFKEGPFFCRQNGSWKELMELYVNSDGQIFIGPEAEKWYRQFISEKKGCSFLLDGDLPKKERFEGIKSPLLSSTDGEIHTVVPGRPFGLLPEHIEQLANLKIHLHFYGGIQQAFWQGWINRSRTLASRYLHIHPHCEPREWVKELSQYDAGWLHYFKSENDGEMMRTVWHDLNYPARMSTLAAAGLPMIQRDNSGQIAASYSLVKNLNMGIFFNSFEDLSSQLHDEIKMNSIRKNVWTSRMVFSFDYHVNDLVLFFRKVISLKREDQTKLKAY